VIKTVLALSIIKNNVAVAKLFYAMMQKKTSRHTPGGTTKTHHLSFSGKQRIS
jgi:hypothetical protein